MVSEGGMVVNRAVLCLLMTSSELDTALGGGKEQHVAPDLTDLTFYLKR